MAKAPTKEVATVDPKSQAIAAFDYGDDAGLGTEGLSSADVSIPFINLLQPLSPEVTGDQALEGAAAGMFFNSVTKDLFNGKTGFLFQPCERQAVFVEWVPRKQGGGFVGIHQKDSAEVIEALRLNGGKTKDLKLGANELIETVYVYGHVLEDDGVTNRGFAVIAFTSTKLKGLRDAMTIVWSTKIGGKTPPLFAYRWRITSFGDKNAEGQPFFNVSIAPKALPLLNPTVDAERALLAEGRAFLDSVRSGARKADVGSAAATPRGDIADQETPF